MSESRVIVELPELERNLLIWFTLLAQRRPSLLRDLWTRRGEDHDRAKIEHARHELARFLAERVLYGSHELTRAAVPMDAVYAENRANEAQG
jgi:hypothetical protein